MTRPTGQAAVPLWWAQAAERLLAAETTLLAWDFDGTLAPLADDPQAVRLPPATQRALGVLGAFDQVHLALVSGRPAGDLVRLAKAPPGTLIAGSHGAELGQICQNGLVLLPRQLSDELQRRLDGIGQSLENLLKHQGEPAGAWIESKPVARVLHTRLLDDAGQVASLVQGAKALGRQLGGHVLEGKDVVEIAVVPAGKASALKKLRQQADAGRLAFAGDDVTDELALRTIQPPDVGIKVGEGASAAEFRLTGPKQMSAFLGFLAQSFGTVLSKGKNETGMSCPDVLVRRPRQR